MAGKTGTTALQTAMGGGKVTDRAAQSALSEAVSRIASLTTRAQKGKKAMVETGTVVLHTVEAQGTLFLASLAEGYLGEDKLKVGAVDLRGPLALVAQGWGLYQTMTGQRGAGGHVLAVGNGLMGSMLASIARNAGQTLADKRAAASAPPPALAPVAMQGVPGLLPEPGLSGPMREVLLTPQADGEELGRGRRGGRRRGMRRMRRRIQRRTGQRQEPEEVEDEDFEGDFDGDDDFGRRRGRRRGRFVRADDDDDDLE